MHSTYGTLNSRFRNTFHIRLTSLKRVRRNNEGNPIEELYFFHFQTQITDYIDHLRGVPVEVSCRSNDLLVTVHANQDKRAAGRILWTNMGYEEVNHIFL